MVPERINPDFPQVDVALVIGANDVVNPAAKTDRSSPLRHAYPGGGEGAPGTVVVLKRSMKLRLPAGAEYELFYKPNTYMLFGDAKNPWKLSPKRFAESQQPRTPPFPQKISFLCFSP